MNIAWRKRGERIGEGAAGPAGEPGGADRARGPPCRERCARNVQEGGVGQLVGFFPERRIEFEQDLDDASHADLIRVREYGNFGLELERAEASLRDLQKTDREGDDRGARAIGALRGLHAHIGATPADALGGFVQMQREAARVDRMQQLLEERAVSGGEAGLPIVGEISDRIPLVSEGTGADALRVGGIEAPNEICRGVAIGGGETRAGEIVCEGDVAAADSGEAAHHALELSVEGFGLAETASDQFVVFEGNVVRSGMEAADEIPGGGGLAVDEFRAEFDGDWRVGERKGADAATDAGACFEKQDAEAAGDGFVCRGEAGGACADDDEVEGGQRD